MYAWRYLLLGIPSAGLLGPAALALTLGRFSWHRAGLSVLLILPLWLLAVWQPYLWSALLWLVALVAVNAWMADGLQQPGAWLRSAGLVLGHILLAFGLVALTLAFIMGDQVQPTAITGYVGWLGGGTALLGLILLELLLRSWRSRGRRT